MSVTQLTTFQFVLSFPAMLVIAALLFFAPVCALAAVGGIVKIRKMKMMRALEVSKRAEKRHALWKDFFAAQEETKQLAKLLFDEVARRR